MQGCNKRNEIKKPRLQPGQFYPQRNYIMNLISPDNGNTIDSIQLLSIINTARVSHGESTVRLNDFVSRAIDELEGEHYETFVVQNSNKTTSKALRLNQDQCMLIAMRESKMVRRAVLAKLKELKGGNMPTLPNFSNPAEAARAWAEQYELNVISQQHLAAAKPKVEFHDKIVNDAATFSLRDAAKKIQQRPNKFSEWLRSNGYLCQNNQPQQRYINQGLFKTHTGTNAEDYQFTQCRMTSKGLAYFTEKLREVTL